MRRVLYVATVVKTHIMEFHIPFLKMLKKMGWVTAVAARNDYENPAECNIPYCDMYFDIPFERNPSKLGNINAYRMLKRIIDSGNFDIIHCHTPVGAMLTRLAAKEARKKGTKVIYTAHGFHFFTGAPFTNWIVYYPVEKWLSKYTDVLITINKEDYKRAKEKLRAGKCMYIPGVGINTEKFSKGAGNREAKRKELGLIGSDFVLLSVGELIARKNHITVIKALNCLKKNGEIGDIHYLICGRGELETKLMRLVKDLKLSDYVHFLGYRDDIDEICNASDLFIFPSKQEGLPVALMEAMSCGVPVICSNIRGNTDLVENGRNGEIVDATGKSLAASIIRLMNNKSLCEEYSSAEISTMKQFDISLVESAIWNIYNDE